MVLLHHQLKRLLSAAVMGCLCLPIFQSVFAKGHKQTVSVSAKRKPHHSPAKKNLRKPVPVHEEWTKRAPVSDEFDSAATNQSDKHDQSALQSKTPTEVRIHGDTMTSVGTPSVFRQTAEHNPVIQKQMTGTEDETLQLLYDGSISPFAFGPASFELNYERQNDRALETTRDLLSGKRQFGINQNRFIESPLERDAWHVGMNYAVGKGSLNAAVDYTRMRNDRESTGSNNDATDLRSITFGYTHNVSENTSFYGSVTHTEYDMGNGTDDLGSSSGDDNKINQVNIGIKHRF